ncbi:MAG: hypothetical protein IJ636_05420 [Bacteroidales bacterium]|nr:hypothetical protein [Bacteroidales bacterium]
MMENRFDIYELPEGHEVRFEARLDRRLSRQRRRQVLVRWSAVAAAAAVLLLLLLPGGRSSFLKARTPEGVYTAYLDQVGKFYEMLAENSEDDSVDWVGLLHELTDETVPLYEQLPEELPRREKTAILKEHYGEILREAHQLKYMNNQ